MFLDFPIADLHGSPVYRVQCASPFASDERVHEFDWSGDFECRVFRPGSRSMPDIQLLADSSSRRLREWESRGRFYWNELVPDCIDYPNWGGTRTYQFRNMQMTIRISSPRIVPPTSFTDNKEFWMPLRGLRVDISGQYDPNASRAVGGPASDHPPPPLDPNAVYGPLQCGPPPKGGAEVGDAAQLHRVRDIRCVEDREAVRAIGDRPQALSPCVGFRR